jgi:hypothetical protein
MLEELQALFVMPGLGPGIHEFLLLDTVPSRA